MKEKGELYTIGRTILFIVLQMTVDIEFENYNKAFLNFMDNELNEIIEKLP